jgi:hypothetical protein
MGSIDEKNQRTKISRYCPFNSDKNLEKKNVTKTSFQHFLPMKLSKSNPI